MGSGDWNDGMNRVGIEGRGESVWLGWFLVAALKRFADLSEERDDVERAARHRRAEQFRKQAEALVEALESQGWDGDWYRRAYYDDGTPLGSAQNRECQIDSLPQSWAVISGAGRAERVAEALAAVDERLVREEDRLLLLFTPPFDKAPHDPGYIKGYPPGIRENGGQYTHGALWVVWANALLGRGDRAEALFRLLNPIHHSETRAQAQRYAVEPYVVAADVYSAPDHLGRGGWTWYTGSSGWMYRAGLEAILGVRREGDHLRIAPSIPADWETYTVRYRYGAATYQIRVENPDGVNGGVRQVIVDGEEQPERSIPLIDDGAEHDVRVVLGASNT
jgi:cellobiose phosphorylase